MYRTKIKQTLFRLKTLINELDKYQLEEKENFIQNVRNKMEKRDTKGILSTECKSLGYKNGCDPKCWKAIEKRGGIWKKRVILAKNLCKSNPNL